jgi:hypothetical protein
MHAQRIEFRFPDSDFEIALNAQIPQVGQTIGIRGGLWKVVDVTSACGPVIVILGPAEKSRLRR